MHIFQTMKYGAQIILFCLLSPLAWGNLLNTSTNLFEDTEQGSTHSLLPPIQQFLSAPVTFDQRAIEKQNTLSARLSSAQKASLERHWLSHQTLLSTPSHCIGYLQDIEKETLETTYLGQAENKHSAGNLKSGFENKVKKTREILNRVYYHRRDSDCFEHVALTYLLSSFQEKYEQRPHHFGNEYLISPHFSYGGYQYLAAFLYRQGYLKFLTPRSRCTFGSPWSQFSQGKNSKYKVLGTYDCQSSTIYIDPFQGPTDLAATFIHETSHLFQDKYPLQVTGLNLTNKDKLIGDLAVGEYVASTSMALFQIQTVMKQFSLFVDPDTKKSLRPDRITGLLQRSLPEGDFSKFSPTYENSRRSRKIYRSVWKLFLDAVMPDKRATERHHRGESDFIDMGNELYSKITMPFVYSLMFLSDSPGYALQKYTLSQFSLEDPNEISESVRSLRRNVFDFIFDHYDFELIDEELKSSIVEKAYLQSGAQVWAAYTNPKRMLAAPSRTSSARATRDTSDRSGYRSRYSEGYSRYDYRGVEVPQQVEPQHRAALVNEEQANWLRYAYWDLDQKLQQTTQQCLNLRAHLQTGDLSLGYLKKFTEDTQALQAAAERCESISPSTAPALPIPERGSGRPERGSGRPERGSGRPEMLLQPCLHDLRP